MRPYILAAFTLCIFLSYQLVASAQDLDSAITKMTEDLAAKISSNQCKKVSVADFTDLEHNPTELGKYIADQVTVDFAMQNRDFSVLDRAHLKKIMDEHQLTASGLVDPENAKKLGMFAGVDALIFGVVTPMGNSVSVTVQVIATDTGTVFTASKAKFQQDDSVQQLLSKPTPAENVSDKKPPQPFIPTIAFQKSGDLLIYVNKMRFVSGSYRIDFTVRNTSAKSTVGIAVYHDVCFSQPCRLPTVLIAGDGTEFNCYDDGVTGIGSTRWSPKPLTAIEPGNEIRASIEFRGGPSISPTVTSFSFRPTFVVNTDYAASAYDNLPLDQNSLPPFCKLLSCFIDFPLNNL